MSGPLTIQDQVEQLNERLAAIGQKPAILTGGPTMTFSGPSSCSEEFLIWQGRWFRIERWGPSDWTIGFGRFEGAVEVYFGKLILRFEGPLGEGQ
jgi:hypothetical protein